eukprot:TRINITY_DN78301_c0_g1_i1.p1 TRINITY_DN78301_c0_g1~~TRINITY_DN78301_c0_g1_i1.p1  ORF type:complete len:1703 (-),score=211.89 TRINITY_DN78301_c0_g1_i1:300-5246(-)
MASRNNYLIEQVQRADEIEVWWPADKQYYPGVVDQVLTNGRFHITYLDGEEEVLRLSTERWRFRGEAADRVARGRPGAINDRKRTRKFYSTHEPEPIVIDDDDDQPPPKRARHKPRTHHSNSVIALDGTPSLSTQQSDVEIEEVPVQVHLPPGSDHRASDVSDPVVSDIEHEVIEEEILDRGYGGDTSSAADTSELRHKNALNDRSTPQTASTHKTAKADLITKSAAPNSSANSLKEHRNSFTAQSASVPARINSTSPTNVPSILENPAAPIISPAPLAAHAYSDPDQSAKPVTLSSSLKLPASAVNHHIPSVSNPSTNATSPLPVNGATRNISSTATSTKSASTTQERSALNTAKELTASTMTKPNHVKWTSHVIISNPAPQKKRVTKSSAPSLIMRAPKSMGKKSLREQFTSAEKNSTATESQGERKKGTTTDMLEIKSVAPATGSIPLIQPRESRRAAIQTDLNENTTVRPPFISLAPAVNVPTASSPSQCAPQRISPAHSGASTSQLRKPQILERGESVKEPIKPVASPARNASDTVVKKAAVVRNPLSVPLTSSASAPQRDAQKRVTQSPKRDSKSQAKAIKAQISIGACTKAQTQNRCTSKGISSQKNLVRKDVSTTKGKEVAVFAQSTTPPKQRTSLMDNNREIPLASSAGPQPFEYTEENSCHERPKAKTLNGSSPNVKSRVSLPRCALLEDAEKIYLEQSQSQAEDVAMSATNASRTSKQIAEPRTDNIRAGNAPTPRLLPNASAVLRKKSRHPSPKVVANERIPRNKCLPAPNASKPMQVDLLRNKSQVYNLPCVPISLSSASDRRFRPTTPTKPLFRISNPTLPIAQLGNFFETHDMPSSRLPRTPPAIAALEGNKSLRKSEAERSDREQEARLPRPPKLKTPGTISIQSLVSSPNNMTKAHHMSPRVEQNLTPMPSFRGHNVQSSRLPVPTNTVFPREASKTYAIALPELFLASSLNTASVSGIPLTSNVWRNVCKIGQTQKIPQTSSSPEAPANQETPNLMNIVRKQATDIPIGSSPPVNSALSKKLPPLQIPAPVQTDGKRGSKSGRKRCIEEHERPEEATKRKKVVTSTKPQSRDMGDAAKLRAGSPVLPKAAFTTSRTKNLDHMNVDGSSSLRRAIFPRTPIRKEKPVLVTAATTFTSPGNRTQATVPLNLEAANFRTSSKPQVSTAYRVLDPFTSLGSQLTAGAPLIKPSTNVSAGFSLTTTSPNPCDSMRVTSLQPIVSTQEPTHVHPASHISNVFEFMRDSEEGESLLQCVLKTIDDKFSMVGRQIAEDFESLKQCIETVSGELSALGSRVDRIDQLSKSDKSLKKLEHFLDKRQAEVTRQMEKGIQESLQIEKQKLQSSCQEVTRKISQVTSTLVNDAIQDIKKGVEQKYRNQRETIEASPKYGPQEVGNESTTITRIDGRETATKSSESQSGSNKDTLKHNGTNIAKRELEHGRPPSSPCPRQMPIPNSASQILSNEAKSIVIPDEKKSQSFEAESSYLIARCVVEWLQNGGCRKRAPKSEREVPVTTEWVNSATLKCFNSILTRLQAWKSYSEAETAINESLAGKPVETEWMTRFTDDACVERARIVYSWWEPKLFDFEWQTEKKVMLEIALRVNTLQKMISDRKLQFDDPLRRSISCMLAARGIS